MFKRRRSMKLKKGKLLKGPLPFRYVLLLSLVFFILLTMGSIVMINKNLEPALMEIAKTRATQFASQAINDAIDKRISDSIDVNDLIIKHQNAGEPSYSFNQQVMNQVISEFTIRVQKYLDLVEAGDLEQLENFSNDFDIDFAATKNSDGIIYHIPLGMATNMTLLSNLGPDIPVKMQILGAVTSNVETKVVETGINNTLLEIYIAVNVKMNVIIPLIEEPIEISNQIKIGDLFHPGKVPQYYNNSGVPNPIAVPPPTSGE